MVHSTFKKQSQCSRFPQFFCILALVLHKYYPNQQLCCRVLPGRFICAIRIDPSGQKQNRNIFVSATNQIVELESLYWLITSSAGIAIFAYSFLLSISEMIWWPNRRYMFRLVIDILKCICSDIIDPLVCIQTKTNPRQSMAVICHFLPWDDALRIFSQKEYNGAFPKYFFHKFTYLLC